MKDERLSDHYTADDLVATGKFCSIYRCPTVGLLKMVAKRYTQRLDEAVHEYELVKKLQHHRIIKYLDILKLDTSVTIKIKQMTTLKDLLKSENKPFSEQKAVLYARQTAEGLLYMHKRKTHPVVHRSIRCSNLFLNNGRELKIGGFFLARQLENARATIDDANLQDFPPDSTPPEILSGKPHGLPANIWQLGYVLVEMLTCDEKVDHLERLPANVHNLVAHMLDKDPFARPTIGSALASLVRKYHELEDSNDEPVSASSLPHKPSAATELCNKMQADSVNQLVKDSIKAENSTSAIEKGESALHVLLRADSRTDDPEIHRKSVTAAQELVETRGSKVTKPNKKGETPIHVASLSGNIEMVQCLVDNSDFLPVNHDLQTPIHLIARSDSKDGASMTEVLLQNFSEHTDLPIDIDGETPLQTAARHGNAPVAETLLRKLADGTVQQLRAELEHKSVDGETALFIASSHGYPNIVRMLLAYGADPNARDARGMLPHETAVVNMNLEVMKALLDTPVPVSDTIPIIRTSKETLLKALDTAKTFDDAEMVDLLENVLSLSK